MNDYMELSESIDEINETHHVSLIITKIHNLHNKTGSFQSLEKPKNKISYTKNAFCVNTKCRGLFTMLFVDHRDTVLLYRYFIH